MAESYCDIYGHSYEFLRAQKDVNNKETEENIYIFVKSADRQ